MRYLAALAVLLLLSSCSSVSNVQELAEVGRTSKVHAPGNWQAAYRAIDARMQQCYNRNNLFGGNSMQVRSQLYDDLQMGEITGTAPGGAMGARQSPYVTMQIRPDGTGAEVTILARKAWISEMEQLVKIWTTSNSEACHP